MLSKPFAAVPVDDLIEGRLRERRRQQAESHRAHLLDCVRGLARDVHPSPGPGALRDRVADQHLIMAVGEGGVGRPFGRVPPATTRRRWPGTRRPNVSAKPSTWPPGRAAAAGRRGP